MESVRNKAEFFSAEAQDFFKKRMLNWANRFSIFLFLDSNSYRSKYSSYEWLMAVEETGPGVTVEDGLLKMLESHSLKTRDWLFGHCSYELKNRLHSHISSRHSAHTGFRDVRFFTPKHVLYQRIGGEGIVVETFEDPKAVFGEIEATSIGEICLPAIKFEHKISRDEYVDVVNRLKTHIADGDCYEINYCNHSYAIAPDLDPLAVFHRLNSISPAPFAAYYRDAEVYMMCASPERYLKKEGKKLISQPIKGTSKRGDSEAEDQFLRSKLRNDPKELAENVMIVDLVRNDFAMSCLPGSVRVEELFGIYTFPQVHQMISTVCGELRDESDIADAIRHSFPMGSMTGAPKHKVMQLIDRYEHAQRELFSGSVGYITPCGDFDFNVVIRSLFYNEESHYLSYATGGAITYDSDPEKEWEETLIKASALERVFHAKIK